MIDPVTLRQQMASANQRHSARAAMAVVSSLQDFQMSKGAMLSGLCASFILVSELTGIHIPDLLMYAKNAMTDGENWIPEYRAVRDFIEKEMLV